MDTIPMIDLDVLGVAGSYRDALHAAYWRGRDYWREMADQACPHLAPRDLVRAAHILHAINYIDVMMTDDGIGRDADDVAANIAEVIATRQVLDPRDIAVRAAAIALDNVSTYRDGDPGRDPRWSAPAAPDAFEGTRHQTVAKRSNSGRTNVKVTRSGVAPVIGRADRTAPTVRRVTRCYGRGLPVPTAWRGLVPSHRMPHVRYVEGPTSAPALPDMPALHAATGLHILEHGPRRSGHHNALHVMAMTARLYGESHVSDLTEHPEITPELAAFDPRGVAVHRSDMSGATGLLALTASYTAADLARHRDRDQLPAIERRKSESDRGLLTSADDQPRVKVERAPVKVERDDRGRITYVPHANHQHDHRASYCPPIWFVVAADGTTTADASPRVWSGHTLVKRGALAATNRDHTRGNRAARTIGTIDVQAFTIATVETVAADLAPGERIVITAADGTRARLNRADDGRYSASMVTADGTRINPRPFRTRTVEAIARKITAAA